MKHLADIDEALAGISPRASGRLKHADRCAALALMKRGFPQALVARTFAISRASAHILAQCETNGKYPAVANDLRNLGFTAFYETYCTPEVRDRLFRAKAEMPEMYDLATAPKRSREKFDSRENGKAGKWILNDYPFEIVLTERGWTIFAEGNFADEYWPTSQDTLRQGVPHWVGEGEPKWLGRK